MNCIPVSVKYTMTVNTNGKIPQDSGSKTEPGLGFNSIFSHPNLTGLLSRALVIIITAHHQMGA